MRSFRLIVLLLSVLALNAQVLAAVTRSSVPPIAKRMAMETDGMQPQAGDDMRMDCCDPDANKQPCAPDKDGGCLCKLGQGCQSPQFSEPTSTLSFLTPVPQLVPQTNATTLRLSQRLSALLRPPIR